MDNLNSFYGLISWDLGEPNSADIYWRWFKINLGGHAHNVALPLLSGPGAIKSKLVFFFFFEREREFQLMASASNDNSLSLDQDTNQFLV